MNLLHTKTTRCFLVVLFVVGICFTVSAQATLQGKITNQFGAPLPYASVDVKGNTKGTVANTEGRYALELKPGEYNIVCAYVGYQRSEKKITIKAGNNEL